tara:strand:+ start:2408 stop:2647 length:240 start_codon:yes stop_codon:yes gene_type:complete
MNIISQILIVFIKGYKFLISPLMGHSCRYFPTCSDYCIEALNTHGLSKGIFMGLKRILSCNPWGNYGFDPVKKKIKGKR